MERNVVITGVHELQNCSMLNAIKRGKQLTKMHAH